MQNGELQPFQELLEAMLRDTAKPLFMNEDIAVQSAPDTMDAVQNATQRDIAVRQIESTFLRVQQVRLALERIAEGNYGICLRCDREISPKRLQALPWACFCIRCQQAADKEPMQNESAWPEKMAGLSSVATRTA